MKNRKENLRKACPMYNPEICKYLDSPGVCAFVRKDKKCKKNSTRIGLKKQYA